MMEDVPYRSEKTVTANSIEIAYDEFGEITDIPILLIMGFSMQMVGWHEEFCSRLAGKGLRVIRFDNRDIGHSSHLTEKGIPQIARVYADVLQGKQPDVPYLLKDMAADTIGLMDALKIDSCHVMGMSMGGMIAQTMALEYPQRLRSLISLSSSPGTYDMTLPPPTPEAAVVLMTPIPPDRDGFISCSVRAWKVIGGPVMPTPDEMLEERARLFYDRGADLGGIVRQLAAIMASGSRRDALKQVRIPTLVIHGDKDPLIPPEHAVATAEAVPGAHLQWISGMGHEVPPAAWDEIITHVSLFVREVEGKTGVVANN